MHKKQPNIQVDICEGQLHENNGFGFVMKHAQMSQNSNPRLDEFELIYFYSNEIRIRLQESPNASNPTLGSLFVGVTLEALLNKLRHSISEFYPRE